MQRAPDCRLYAVDDEVVWVRPTATPPPTPFAVLADAGAVPYLNGKSREGYQKFLAMRRPRAFPLLPPVAGGQRHLLLSTLRVARPEHGALRYGIAPHSLRAVSEDSLRAALQGLDAMSPGAPVHIHIAEQTAEVDACLAALGARPVQWLLERFDVDARWCLVHATHVDERETLALAKSGAIAGLCLTTEANLGDGLFPASDYLDAGGAFGVGSDSHIGVDWRAELRLLKYGQRLARRQRNVLASLQSAYVADRLFQGALAGGARATGRAVGALEQGARADWIVLDPDHPDLAGQTRATWLSSVVFCEHGQTPMRDVFVGGERVIHDGRHRD
jgi:formimidoylglutamate deiminase